MSIVLIVLVLVFSLIACNSKETNEGDKDIGQVEEDDVLDEDMDSEDEAEVDQTLDEETDPVNLMIDSSDYISKIKLIEKGKDNVEIKILDNIKDPLNSTDLPSIDNLELHKTYIVFMKNLDGKVVLTDEENEVILLEGDNHELFEKINKKHNK